MRTYQICALAFFCITVTYTSGQIAEGTATEAAQGMKSETANTGYPGCHCHAAGSVSAFCDPKTGQCPCKINILGRSCDRCATGYYDFPQCLECNCHAAGSAHNFCEPNTGQCACEINFAGRACDLCRSGYYKLPDCLDCECDPTGATGTSCDIRGQCQCKKNFAGKTCDQCSGGLSGHLCDIINGIDDGPGMNGEVSSLGIPGPKGPSGKAAFPGALGLKGEMGNAGFPGLKGMKGGPGIPGAMGRKGEYGIAGLTGPQGVRGASGIPGAMGRKGEFGIAALPGVKGLKDEAGVYGAPGVKGDRGDSGFPGRPGVDLETFKREIIESVRQSLQGPVQSEPKNDRTNLHQTVGYVVRHSQSSTPTSCPHGASQLWIGYSFVASSEVQDAAVRAVDLGTTVSCLPRFSSSPLLHCQTGERCSASSSVSTWLSDLSADNQAGRCVVCQVVHPPIAVHSQSTEIPQCPTGWSALWTGYTFVSKSTSYQLASPGSCLEKFKHNPLIECSGGQCASAGSEGLWMAAVASPNQETIASTDNQGNRTEPVSRCQVCIKTSVQ